MYIYIHITSFNDGIERKHFFRKLSLEILPMVPNSAWNGRHIAQGRYSFEARETKSCAKLEFLEIRKRPHTS